MSQSGKKISRNDPCPCGSGKKYKKCCLQDGTAKRQSPRSENFTTGLNKAQALETQGQLSSAEQVYRQLKGENPREPSLFQQFGKLLCRMERFTEGVTELKQAAELIQKRKSFPNRAWVLADIAMAILNGRNPSEALVIARMAKNVQPDHPRMHYILALCLERLNRNDEALRSVEYSHRLEPGKAIATLVLARLYGRVGEFDKANTLLARVVNENSDSDTLNRAYREWALILDKTGHYEEAFKAAIKAGQEALKIPPFNQYDLDAVEKVVQANRSGFNESLLNRWSMEDFNDGLPAPAFLLGFFRSGTTLTEQVLAAHPDIVTTDETLYLYRTREELRRIVAGTGSVSENAVRLTLEQAHHLRKFYWDLVNQHLGDEVEGKIVVDKNALNSIDIGLINTLFPDARILFALRDPRDVCVSCFLQAFSPSDLTVHLLDWQNCAKFYAQVMGLWVGLRDKLGTRYIEVRYEDTVADLEDQARKILDLLDADWNSDVLAFHEQASQRYIGTPSFSDVSKPIYKTALARWRNYDTPITEVMPVLEPFVKEFGYS